MRSVLRLIAYLVLAGGMIVAVVDATRSVALSAVTLTTLRDGLARLAPDGSALAAALSAAPESVTGQALSIPLAALAAVLFVLIYALAQRGRRPRHF